MKCEAVNVLLRFLCEIMKIKFVNDESGYI